MKIEFDEVRPKSVSSSSFPLASMVDASLDLPTPASRVRDVFDQFPPLAGAVSIRYAEVGQQSYSAGSVTEGGAKPESGMVVAAKTAEARKIAHWLPDVSREALQDVAGLQRFVDDFLVTGLLEAEDAALISGDGVAPNVLGLANVPGKQTHAFSVNQIETIRKAITKLQDAFLAPTGLLLNPADWEAIELLKDLDDRYLLVPTNATPRAAGGPSSVWGIPVITSAAVPSGTAYLVDGRFLKYGPVERPAIFMDAVTKLRNNLVNFVGEERVIVYYPRPAAIVELDLSPRSVAYHRMILRRALQDAVREGLLVRNPVDLTKAPPQRRREMRTLDAEQVKLFLGEARRSSRYFRLYLAAVLTGMRIGELLGLRWQDCDLVGGTASVRQTFGRLGKRLIFGEPKTRTSRRSIPLHPELVRELLAQRDEQDQQKGFLGERYTEFGLVFCQPNGKPLHAHNIVQRDLRRVLRRAGLPRMRFHDLRHTAATLLFAQKTHPKVVADLLGHSSIGVTLDVYSHAIPALAEEAALNLGMLLVSERAGERLPPIG